MYTFKAQRQTMNGENLYFVVKANTQLETLNKVLSGVPAIRSNGWYSDLFIDTLEDTLENMIAQSKFNYFDSLILIETTMLVFSSGLAPFTV